MNPNSIPHLNDPVMSFSGDPGLAKLMQSMTQSLTQDALVERETDRLRTTLEVDRVVLYYFYRQWQGQVTFESVSHDRFSILGTTGADECFNDEYAAMYREGRVRAIEDIDVEPIHGCHRDFLCSIGVRANLVVPILAGESLWGLLVAHHCQSPRLWLASEIEMMKTSARILAQTVSIR